jgi:hypothetical protein
MNIERNRRVFASPPATSHDIKRGVDPRLSLGGRRSAATPLTSAKAQPEHGVLH